MQAASILPARRCAATGATLQAGAPGAVSIRQHDIAMSAVRPATGENVLPAKVIRHVFLGGSRDYMVEINDGTQLRVVTGAGVGIREGDAVFLHMPAEKCRALAG